RPTRASFHHVSPSNQRTSCGVWRCDDSGAMPRGHGKVSFRSMTDGASRKPEPSRKSKIDGLHGRVIAGKFQIQELIGVGAMGRVYKAHNQALDKIVAVKVLTVPDGMQ